MRTRVTTTSLVLLVLVGLALARPAHSLRITTTVSSDRVQVGDGVAVTVAVQGLAAGAAPSVGAFDLLLDYDVGVLSPTGFAWGAALDLGVLGSVNVVDATTPGVLFVTSVSFEPVHELDLRQPAAFTLFTAAFAAIGFGTSALDVRAARGGIALADAFGDPLPASFDDIRVTVTPEPGSAGLLASGFVLLAGVVRRRARMAVSDRRGAWLSLWLACTVVALVACAPRATRAQVLIDEALVSQPGVDDTEFVELFGAAGRSLAGVSLIAVEGDAGAVPGTIDARIDFDVGDAIGTNSAFLVGNPVGLAIHYGVVPDRTLDDDGFENSSLTLALIETSSLVGTHVTGREIVLDAVALSDGGAGDRFFFGAPVLGPEGMFFPAGVQRIVRGVDTNSTADFALAPFQLGPLATPTSATGIAPATPITIPRLQGPGVVTPFDGLRVVTRGVVVAEFQRASRLGGFFAQDIDGDGDAATSDGIFVAMRAPLVSPGDVVEITGRVRERSGRTQIEDVTALRILGAARLPDPVPYALPEPSNGDLERLEGMLIAITSPMTVTGNYFLGRYGQLTLSGPDDSGAPGRLFHPTQLALPGAPALALAADNARRVLVLDDGQDVNPLGDNPNPVPYPGAAPPAVPRAGDLVSQLVGVLDEGRIDAASTPRTDYRLHPTLAPTFTTQNPRPPTPLRVPARLRVASFNVLNYFTTIDHGPNACGPTGTLDCRGADTAAEFVRQRDKILSAIASLDAHVVGLIELENNAAASLTDLVAGLNAIDGPGVWAFVDTGRIGSDAVKVGLVYRTAMVATHGAFAVLDDRLDARAISSRNRPSLAQTFRERATGELVTVVVNHFKSKGSDCDVPRVPGELRDPDLGDGQGNCNRTRTSISRALRDWLAGDPTASVDPDVLVVGDLNANAHEDPVTTLEAAGFVDLIGALGGPHRHSYVFDGEAGALDHLLASATLRAQVTAALVFPINADEPPILGYDTEYNPPGYYEPTPWRSSDHDPEVADLSLCVDRSDLVALLARSRTHPTDSRWDLDGDGRTTVADGRRLALRFTHPGGAPCP